MCSLNVAMDLFLTVAFCLDSFFCNFRGKRKYLLYVVVLNFCALSFFSVTKRMYYATINMSCFQLKVNVRYSYFGKVHVGFTVRILYKNAGIYAAL